jgi:transcriptional regulator with XRE-family HTH domain
MILNKVENRIFFMSFSHRLIELRKQRTFTQQGLADEIGIHVSQLKRYEAGTSQPTLEVLKKLALTLRISTDELIFNSDERIPQDDYLKRQFEAVEKLDDKEKETIKTMIDGILLMHDAKKYARS